MSKHHSTEIKEKVIKFRLENETFEQIALRLDLPKSSVHSIYKNWVDTGSIERKDGSGRPEKLSVEKKELSIKLFKKRRKYDGSTGCRRV